MNLQENGDKVIIWDWNGTLLDDVDICVESINVLLKRYSLLPISKSKYLQIFSFPVINYYKQLGFNFSLQNFPEIAAEFYEQYLKRLPRAALYQNALISLKYFQKKNYPQYIISAMQQEKLIESVNLRKISSYFSSINGLTNIYAESKQELAQKIINQIEIPSENVFFIGDTIHDWEVAEAVGCQHILIANGHQPYEKLQKKTQQVIPTLKDLLSFIN